MKHDYLQLQTWIRNWTTPYKRYQFQRNIHALRLACAVVCAILVGHIFHLKHSEWIPITVFVILGTIPYQGSIAEKAFERIIGTIIGMAIGLTLLGINQHFFQHDFLFFLSVGIISALCGYYSLTKRGYAAMLAGLTICMLLGHSGDNWVQDGLFRAVNVIIGAAIALNTSQMIPIKATMVWRFTTSDNLAACATQLGNITSPKSITPESWQLLQTEQRAINARLVKARSMMSATAIESGIPLETLENLQQNHRGIVGDIQLMLMSVQHLPKPHLAPEEEKLLMHHFVSLQHDLWLISLMLRGDWQQNVQISFHEEASIRILASKLPFETQGFIWTSLNIRTELAQLLNALQIHRQNWLMTRN